MFFFCFGLGSTCCFAGFSGIPFFRRSSSAIPINIAVISHARHSSSSRSISLSTSSWFKLFIGFCPTYIQLPLSIDIPFYIDAALHLPSYPLCSSFGFITHFFTRSYIATSRLWPHTDGGTTFPRKRGYQ